jgi:hypothetical protein
MCSGEWRQCIGRILDVERRMENMYRTAVNV